jgi:uncharacterized protein (TIGR00297 family)
VATSSGIVLGIVLSALITGIAFRRGALSASGAGAAVVVGTVIFVGGGWLWGGLLVLFFVSSSLLTRFRSANKRDAAAAFAKGGRRDAWQVLANGGVAAGFALLQGLAPTPAWFAGFVGALSAATADTWATELGTLSRNRPRLITTGRPVAAGTSGALSAPGTLAALMGGSVVGIAAGLGDGGWSAVDGLWRGALAGLIGSGVDSVLGATVQGVFRCPLCERQTEAPVPHCGTRTVPLRGIPWLGNDGVNALATAFGAGVLLPIG